MITIYGIKNCDTMKKTFDWMENQKVKYQFHNYKTEGLTILKINEWLTRVTISELINQKGTTFRNLTEIQKKKILTTKTAAEIILLNPSVIKRPLIEWKDKLFIGFTPAIWHFGKQ